MAIINILVPLDGSNLAEAALPVAERLAKALNAKITIIHVIEHKAPQEVHGERHLTSPDDASQYLDHLAKAISSKGIRVEQHVHTNEVDDVAQSIVEHAGEYTPDLIVLCSHGWGGLRDLLVGNIAQQVIAHGTTPVLLVHPQAGKPAEFKCMDILVPMDAKSEHSHGLVVAADLARACGASLTLMMVVPTLGTLGGHQAATGRLLPAAMSALLDFNEQEAEVYLENKAKAITGYGIPISYRVLRGDPAPMIVEFANQMQADLIVVGTHGKSGTGAFWAGSVAPKLTTSTTIPLLFVPIHNA